jgi:hypothetical protein
MATRPAAIASIEARPARRCGVLHGCGARLAAGLPAWSRSAFQATGKGEATRARLPARTGTTPIGRRPAIREPRDQAKAPVTGGKAK